MFFGIQLVVDKLKTNKRCEQLLGLKQPQNQEQAKAFKWICVKYWNEYKRSIQLAIYIYLHYKLLFDID